MKRFIALATVMPGSVLAHGAHAPVPDSVHMLNHTAVFLAVGVLVVIGGLALRQLFRS